MRYSTNFRREKLVTTAGRPARHHSQETTGQGGQGMVEYAFILILVSVIAILVVLIIGHQTSNQLSNVANAFPSN